MSHKITDTAKQLEFVLGNKATFTIENEATATRITYRVELVEQATQTYEVMAMTGSDNTSKGSYTLVGRLVNNQFEFPKTETDYLPKIAQSSNQWEADFAKSLIKRLNYGPLSDKQVARLNLICKKNGYTVPRSLATDSVHTRTFKWLFTKLNTTGLPQGVNFYHEGLCCRCNLPLTVPASIMTGYGPNCADVVGITAEWKRLNKSFPPKA